jgi:hypothetical protein
VIKENTSQAFQDFKNHVIYSLLSWTKKKKKKNQLTNFRYYFISK